jgi:DNA-binding response OmpR family regulator
MNKKILVIEDEDSLSEVLFNKLTFEGFDVLVAKDGFEGLRLASENHPDLIILDIIMPEMDGVSMLQKLRNDDWGKEVPVIMLTNLSDTDKISEVMTLGVDDFLVKANWEITDLVKKIKEKLKIS